MTNLSNFTAGPPPAAGKGRLRHRAIGRLLARGVTSVPSRSEVFEVMRPELEVLSGPTRQSLFHEICTGVVQYFRLCPVGRGVRFMGAEVDVPGSCLDLLFEEPSGALYSDEIKTGRSLGTYEMEKLSDQVVTQVEGGHTRFGDSFVGVRAVLLSRPQDSYILTTWGERLPLITQMGTVMP